MKTLSFIISHGKCKQKSCWKTKFIYLCSAVVHMKLKIEWEKMLSEKIKIKLKTWKIDDGLSETLLKCKSYTWRWIEKLMLWLFKQIYFHTNEKLIFPFTPSAFFTEKEKHKNNKVFMFPLFERIAERGGCEKTNLWSAEINTAIFEILSIRMSIFSSLKHATS